MINYKIVSLLSSIIFFTLFMSLLLYPESIFWLFQIEGNESAYFISRRASMLFLGYALITYFSRFAENTELRQAIILGLALAMFGLALLGLFEFLRGYVGIGIFLAISAETFLSVTYLSIWLSSKKLIIPSVIEHK